VAMAGILKNLIDRFGNRTLDEYLSVKSLSQYIPKSPGAIRNLVLRRAIPFRKVGGRLIFKKHEIDQWIESSPGVSFKEITNSDGALRKGNGDPTPGDPRPSGQGTDRRAPPYDSRSMD
jgi:hypothetical protein